jgi:hypothetical protein
MKVVQRDNENNSAGILKRCHPVMLVLYLSTYISQDETYRNNGEKEGGGSAELHLDSWKLHDVVYGRKAEQSDDPLQVPD